MTEADFHARAQSLRARATQAISHAPSTRVRALAASIGVSEAQWVAAGCGGLKVVPLTATPQAIFRVLPTLGRVMALTRNEWCVHERKGTYENVHATGPMGLVLGPDIDLRLFFTQWSRAWAVEQEGRRSIQFFDAAGVAIHKVYLLEDTDAQAYEALVGTFTDADAPVWPEPVPYSPAVVPDTPTDQAGLRQAWLALEDTHDFFPMLKTFNVSRLGALRAAGKDLAQSVGATQVEHMLTRAAEAGIPIMCFVGNRGMIQIHSGPVATLRRTGPWFNVLDPDFNLHLDTTAIDQAWVVNKPTSDGWVTSLEVYAANGELIVQFFGARKPGTPELAAWRALLIDLCPAPLAA